MHNAIVMPILNTHKSKAPEFLLTSLYSYLKDFGSHFLVFLKKIISRFPNCWLWLRQCKKYIITTAILGGSVMSLLYEANNGI